MNALFLLLITTPCDTEVMVIRRLRVLPFAAGLGLLLGCGSPTAPELPGNPPEEEEDPKTDMIGLSPTTLTGISVTLS